LISAILTVLVNLKYADTLMHSIVKLRSLFSLILVAIFNHILLAERIPTENGIVYGVAARQQLTMDYYAPQGAGPHPAVIIIHSGGFVAGDSRSSSETYCADFLVPAGYAVFSINYRLAPKFSYPAPIQDVERVIRFVRANAHRWDVDPAHLALIGGSAGGYLGAMAGLEQAQGNETASDPVDRECARVQAVVSLYGLTGFENIKLSKNEHLLLDPFIRQKGKAAALREASPAHLATKTSPPFLQIIGDKDEYFGLSTVTEFDQKLRDVGVSSTVIVIPGGTHGTSDWYRIPNAPDWERRMTEWLNAMLFHAGPIGEGIKIRQPTPQLPSSRQVFCSLSR
jgi:acetyl esterase